MKKYFFLSLAGVLLSCAAGCRTVPVTDRSQLMLTPSGYENELGEQTYQEYKSKYKQSGNAVYNKALTRCGNAISKVADAPGFQWEFLVFESSEQNAFCLPGGKVAVYSGLMDLMKNEAELACVVAHEAGHAIARHSGERISWSELQTLGAIGVALGCKNETISDIYGTGTELGVMLPFSRENEYEADYIGLVLMSKAGYNPQAALDFWTRFSKGKKSSFAEKLTSTHPCDEDRIANFQKNLSSAQQYYRAGKSKKNYGVVFRK